MKILITGGSGLLGQYLNTRLAVNYKILTLYHQHPGNCYDYNSVKTDITEQEQVQRIFETFQPDIVVHTAAVSQSESSLPAKLINNINVKATGHIAKLCNDFDVKLIYTSTDLVYAGYRGSMLDENAKLIPVSLYAETKLMGEEKIKQQTNNFIILRTALLFGFGLNHSVSHFQKMYNDLKKGNRINLFVDQFRTPLALTEAARIIEILCGLNLSGEIINFGGPERLSRYELGVILCEEGGLNKDLLNPIKMADLPGYPAVEDVSLNTNKLKSLGIEQKSVRELIRDLI